MSSQKGGFMNGFATVMVAGNLVRDVEMKYGPTGIPFCEFGIAVNERWGQGEDRKERVSYFDVTCFGKTAEVAAQYLQKGKPVAIEGKLQQDRWETEGGQKRSKIQIIGNRIHFLPDGKGGEQPQE
jgi:single-strand DNA-binding protein